MTTPGLVKKSLALINEKLHHSTREENVVARFGYNDYIAYHYAFVMKLATIQESENFAEAAQDPRRKEAMSEEM